MEEPYRFLDSEVAAPESPHFEALGHTGSGHYAGLETFDNPGCAYVKFTSDEVIAKCPVTGQPDYYVLAIELVKTEKLIESKSLKLFLQNIHEASIKGGFGLFCEALAVHIKEQVMEAVGCEDEEIRVTLTQKSRGGITIEAVT